MNALPTARLMKSVRDALGLTHITELLNNVHRRISFLPSHVDAVPWNLWLLLHHLSPDLEFPFYPCGSGGALSPGNSETALVTPYMHVTSFSYFLDAPRDVGIVDIRIGARSFMSGTSRLESGLPSRGMRFGEITAQCAVGQNITFDLHRVRQ